MLKNVKALPTDRRNLVLFHFIGEKEPEFYRTLRDDVHMYILSLFQRTFLSEIFIFQLLKVNLIMMLPSFFVAKYELNQCCCKCKNKKQIHVLKSALLCSLL